MAAGNVIWLSIIILLIVSTKGIVNGRISIVKGRDANIADFPHQVSLRDHNQHFCGGSIISEIHVLSAGHCFENGTHYPYDSVIVVSGTSYLDNEHGQHHKIAHVTVHPHYFLEDTRPVNDLAVIMLKDSIIFNIHQQKINLPKHNFKPGDKAIVTGWGFIKPNNPTLPHRLQKLETELISLEKCQKKVARPKTTKIYDTEICDISGKGHGICMGDSGGPLTVNNELVGIVSWINGGHCASIFPDISTNVYMHKHFIESVINHNH